MSIYSTIRYVSSGGGGGGSGVTTYSSYSAFPAASEASNGDLAFADDTGALYVFDGSEWDRIAAGSDETPVITTDPASSHSLNRDGSTSTVTMVAEDPEGFDIEYGIAYKTSESRGLGSNGLPVQITGTSINQSTGVYTFTPSTTESDAGAFTARLSASDGVKMTTRTVLVDLGFFPIEDSAIIGKYHFFDTDSYNATNSTTALNDLSGNGNNQTIVNPGSLSNGNLSFTANSTSITFTGLNATKAWCIIYGPPTDWSNALMFGTGGSTYYGVFASGSSSNYYSGYSAHSGATIVDRVNGTNPTNRGTAYSAMDLGSMNSIMNSGTNMSTSLAYSQYSSYRPAHEVRAFVFFNRELTLSEMEDLHDYYRTNWTGTGGTMPTWGN